MSEGRPGPLASARQVARHFCVWQPVILCGSSEAQELQASFAYEQASIDMVCQLHTGPLHPCRTQYPMRSAPACAGGLTRSMLWRCFLTRLRRSRRCSSRASTLSGPSQRQGVACTWLLLH